MSSFVDTKTTIGTSEMMKRGAKGYVVIRVRGEIVSGLSQSLEDCPPF